MLTSTAVAVVAGAWQAPREAVGLARARTEHCIPDLPPDVVRALRMVDDAHDALAATLAVHTPVAVPA